MKTYYSIEEKTDPFGHTVYFAIASREGDLGLEPVSPNVSPLFPSVKQCHEWTRENFDFPEFVEE